MSDRKAKIEAQAKLRALLKTNDELREVFVAAFPKFASVLLDPSVDTHAIGERLPGFSEKLVESFMDWDADHPNAQCIYAVAPKRR